MDLNTTLSILIELIRIFALEKLLHDQRYNWERSFSNSPIARAKEGLQAFPRAILYALKHSRKSLRAKGP